jgi:hypothetical protein
MTNISGKSIIITAVDNSIKTVARSQGISADQVTKIKEDKSIGGSVSRGSVTEIMNSYPKTDSYKVKFDLPDETDYYLDAIKTKESRDNKSLEHPKVELGNYKYLKT